MQLLPLDSARALRDGGIDPVAALDDALKDVLRTLPQAMHDEVKHAVGRAMAAVLSETVERAIRLHPELEPNDQAWAAIAKARAAKRAVS